MSDYTILNLDEIDDSATGRGLDFGSARFPRDAVGRRATGFAHITLHPGRHQPFGHRHKEAEEVYYVISGSGAIKLDDGVHQLRARDIVRLAPHVTRSLEGGPDGMELIVFGARVSRRRRDDRRLLGALTARVCRRDGGRDRVLAGLGARQAVRSACPAQRKHAGPARTVRSAGRRR